MKQRSKTHHSQLMRILKSQPRLINSEIVSLVLCLGTIILFFFFFSKNRFWQVQELHRKLRCFECSVMIAALLYVSGTRCNSFRKIQGPFDERFPHSTIYTSSFELGLCRAL